MRQPSGVVGDAGVAFSSSSITVDGPVDTVVAVDADDGARLVSRRWCDDRLDEDERRRISLQILRAGSTAAWYCVGDRGGGEGGGRPSCPEDGSDGRVSSTVADVRGVVEDEEAERDLDAIMRCKVSLAAPRPQCLATISITGLLLLMLSKAGTEAGDHGEETLCSCTAAVTVVSSLVRTTEAA